MPLPTQLFLGAIAVISLILSIYNLGDRFIVDEGGISYENRLIKRRWGGRRRLEWSEVVHAKEYRGKTLFLFLEEGKKRFVIDSIDDYEGLKAIILSNVKDFHHWRGVKVMRGKWPTG